MRAQLFHKVGRPLQLAEIECPRPGPTEVQIEVRACAVCRTDLHIVDGDLKQPKRPLVPGHEITGIVTEIGDEVDSLSPGDRVGVPWLGWTCGSCRFCRSGEENLCGKALFTGYNLDGGYADYTVSDQRFCLPLPVTYSFREAAPLLCAGLIGFRSLRMAGGCERLGIYGFGAAAHIVSQIALFEGRKVFALTRPGDTQAQEFARRSGACWSGGSDLVPPEELDAAIIFAPIGELVPKALKSLRRGGTVVCGGIHMTQIPAFPYELLWGERTVRSVANLTRQDGIDFMELAPKVPVRTTTVSYPLESANQALCDLRDGHLQGAAVLET